MEENKEFIERMWKWIDRPVDEEFWTRAGHYSREENLKLFNEIPVELKPTAQVMISLACEFVKKNLAGETDNSCLVFRIALFDVYNKLKEKGIELFIPYGWFADAVMIEPEWIVRITNGIIGWTCNPKCISCGRENECRYAIPGNKPERS